MDWPDKPEKYAPSGTMQSCTGHIIQSMETDIAKSLLISILKTSRRNENSALFPGLDNSSVSISVLMRVDKLAKAIRAILNTEQSSTFDAACSPFHKLRRTRLHRSYHWAADQADKEIPT